MIQQAIKHFRLAQSYFYTAQLDEARICIEKARAIDPDDLDLLDLHGRICVSMKDYSSAEPLLRDLIQKAPTNTKALHRLSQVLMALDAYDEAIAILQQLTEISHQDIQIKTHLGVAYASCGKTEEAVKYFRALVAENPGTATYWYHLAKSLFKTKDYSGAVAAVNKCIRIAPTSKKAVFLLSQIYVEQHGCDPAFLCDDQFVLLSDIALNEMLCKQLVKNNVPYLIPLFCQPSLMSHFKNATIGLACRAMIDANDLENAKVWLNTYLRNDEYATHVMSSQGNAYLDQNKNEKALVCFEGCLLVEPNNEYIIRGLCECLLRLGDPERAIAYLDLHKLSSSVYLKYIRAKALAACDEYKQAINVMMELLIINPDDARYNSYIAYLYLRFEDYRCAEEFANKSLSLDNSKPYFALNTLGFVFYEKKNYSQAEQYFRRAIIAAPEKVSPKISLAHCILAQGNISKAYELLNTLDRKIGLVQSAIRDVLLDAINNGNDEIVYRIIQDAHGDFADTTDEQRIHLILSGAYDNDESHRHIKKHFYDDQLKPIHGVFTMPENELSKILTNLSSYSYENHYNIKKYRIPYQNAGYDGGAHGDQHILNYITVLAFLSEDYIITAYPSD